MKKLLTVLAGLSLFMAFAMPSDASWNIRQKGNGSTVWTDGSVEVPTGDTGLVVPISSFSNTVTHFTMTHKKGRVKKVYVVNYLPFAAGSASPTIDILYSTGVTAGFTPVSEGGTLTMTTASWAGRVSSLEPSDPDVVLDQGVPIAVAIDGGSVTGGGTVLIVIE